MAECPKYYTYLFNRVTDAIEELRARNFDAALEILIASQFDAEELYLKDGEHRN